MSALLTCNLVVNVVYFRCCRLTVNIIKWPLILLIIPPLINYASLKQEQEMLIPADATLYDIGQGQRLMMRCKGRGAPTVILESPAGGCYITTVCSQLYLVSLHRLVV